MITINCPNCNTELDVNDVNEKNELLGREFKCLSCGHEWEVGESTLKNIENNINERFWGSCIDLIDIGRIFRRWFFKVILMIADVLACIKGYYLMHTEQTETILFFEIAILVYIAIRYNSMRVDANFVRFFKNVRKN